MKKFITLLSIFFAVNAFADVVDTTKVEVLDSVSVVSFYRNNINVGSLVNHQTLVAENHGQEPSHLFRKMPGIFSMSDNGTEFGYGYFRIRGLDQTRINVTLDGMPWNEAEDYGTYFANSPDILSSMHSVKVERGTSATNNGTASSGGSINLESVNLLEDTESYAYVGGGSFKTYKTSVVYNSGLIDKHALHIKATQQQTDGYRENGFNNSQAFTVKYGYFFNPKHSVEFLSLNGRHRNGQGWLGNTLAELEVNPRANGNIKTEDDEWFQSVNKIQYKGWLTDKVLLTASTYLQYQTGWYNMDLDNYMRRMADPAWEDTGMLYTYGLTHYLYGGNVFAKYYMGDFTFTAGTNIYGYQREHYLDDRLSSHFANIKPADYYDNTGYKFDGNVFGSIQLRRNKFNIVASLQYRHTNFRYKDWLDDSKSFTAKDEHTYWNFFNGGVNAEYDITTNSKVYLRYAEVSREPTRTDMFYGNETMVADHVSTVNAERSYDVEGGYVITSEKIDANVNLYFMGFKGERVLTGEYGVNGLPLHEYAYDSYRRGVEVSLDWNFWNSFHYALNTSLSDNTFYTDTYRNGRKHILTPGFTLNNDIYYKVDNWTAGINNIYHSKMYMDQANEYEIPAYLTFNAYGSYRYKNFEVGLRINNILNKTNYYNAALGVEELFFREAGTNFFADLKIYF